MTDSNPISPVVIKEGYAKKRNGRLQQWSHRYFVLTPNTICYKLKQDSPNPRNTFDLSSSCIVTEIIEERTVAGRKIFTFWIVWPGEKKSDSKGDGGGIKKDDSDDENAKSDDEMKESRTGKSKDLKQIVEQETLNHKRQKNLVNEQIELHQAHDSNVSMGAKVAAVAVGGVLVGALTAGIGLVPYLTVVGITAAASGSAVALSSLRRPLDSRLIMACDTVAEANEWRAAIQSQIDFVSAIGKPALPPAVNPSTLHGIIDRTQFGGMWKTVRIKENMRIVEHVQPNTSLAPTSATVMFCEDAITPFCSTRNAIIQSQENQKILTSRCRRAQSIVPATPQAVFLALMNTRYWPKEGKCEVVKEVDDHADFIGVEIPFKTPQLWQKEQVVTRKLCFSRFWQVDDDGVYLITYNSSTTVEYPHAIKKAGKTDFRLVPADSMPAIDAVITITPRQDCEHFDFEIPEALVTCSCQINDNRGFWSATEMNYFMNSFLQDHILELRYALTAERFDIVYKDQVLVDPHFPHETPGQTPGPPSTGLQVLPPKFDRTLFRRNKSGTLDSSGNVVTQHSATKEAGSARSLVKRGVTTIQPGMEETSLTLEDIPPHYVGSPTDKLHRSNRLMRMFTRKRHDDHTVDTLSPVVAVPVENSNAKRLSFRRRSQANAEAHSLRRQIATTEYEMQRMNRALKKSVVRGANGNTGAVSDIPPPPGDLSPHKLLGKTSITPTEYKELNDSIYALQTRLYKLKEDYLNLVGETYEQAMQARTTFGRLKSLGFRKRQNHPSNLTEDASDGAGKLNDSSEKHTIGLPRPRHWLPVDYGLPKEPRKSAVKQIWELLTSQNYWRLLFCMVERRPFLVSILRDQPGYFFPLSHFIVLLGVIGSLLAMALLNHFLVLLFQVSSPSQRKSNGGDYSNYV
eukprot:gene8023-8850_t